MQRNIFKRSSSLDRFALRYWACLFNHPHGKRAMKKEARRMARRKLKKNLDQIENN